VQEGKQQAGKGYHGEEHRQQMHEFEAARMPLHQIDAGNTAVVNLLEEFFEVRTPLVPDPCFREKAAACAALVDAQAQVDVLAKSHGREATQLTVKAATDAQIEGTRVELLVHLLLAATDATGSQERGHAVANGLLDRGETFVSSVGTAPGITFLTFQFVIHRLQEIRRQHTIAVQEDEELALAVLSAIVARRPRSTVLLGVIAKRQLPCEFVYNTFARPTGTVLHDDDLHVMQRLLCQALEQFIHLVGTIIYGNDD